MANNVVRVECIKKKKSNRIYNQTTKIHRQKKKKVPHHQNGTELFTLQNLSRMIWNYLTCRVQVSSNWVIYLSA